MPTDYDLTTERDEKMLETELDDDQLQALNVDKDADDELTKELDLGL